MDDSLLIAASAAFLALLAIAVLVALMVAIRQNRELWRGMTESERPARALLRDALVLWSPLALLIVLLAFAANRTGEALVGLTYRLTTIDEFCELENGARSLVIPCTGLDETPSRSLIHEAGPRADLERYLSLRYRRSRNEVLGKSGPELKALAANRPAFYRALSAPAVLGLEPAPEDDAELARLKLELLTLVRTPVPPARDVLDIVRYVTERDARLRRMRALTAQVTNLREQVNQQAYAGLSREQQGQLALRHRFSHVAARAAQRPDATTELALARLLNGKGDEAEALVTTRRGILAALAKSEVAVADALDKEAARSRVDTAALYLALPMARYCTVVPAGGLQINSGAFPCQDTAGDSPFLQLSSLGFRESIRRSVARWHEDALRTSVSRLGRLALSASTSQAEATALARDVASAVPQTIPMGRSPCGMLHPGNCLANVAREAAEQGIAEARNDVEGRAVQQVEEFSGTTVATIEQQVGQRLLTLDAELGALRKSADAYLQRFFLLHDLFRVLGWLAVALVALKSFLYVLALELFHSDEKMSIGFDTLTPVQGSYRSARQLTIDRDFPRALITRKQLSNTDNNVCFAPWPGSAPLARILRRKYFIFTRGRFLADAQPHPGAGAEPRGMVASAAGGLSIVEWKMQPGEEVIFRYKDFYGASENVQLASEFSFRLSTLLLGRIIFRIARCPEGEGRLLLRANVEEVDQETIRAIPPERMLAWSRHARFTVHSSRTLWKTLLNGYTLVRRERLDGPGGLIVVSSDDVGSNLGSIRFVRRIFSAIF